MLVNAFHLTNESGLAFSIREKGRENVVNV